MERWCRNILVTVAVTRYCHCAANLFVDLSEEFIDFFEYDLSMLWVLAFFPLSNKLSLRATWDGP